MYDIKNRRKMLIIIIQFIKLIQFDRPLNVFIIILWNGVYL